MTDKLLTPQQELILAEYLNPRSPNFGNARQSALKAGYAETYANNITDLMPEWLLENIGDMKRLRKAEKVLDRTLEYEPMTEEGKIDNSLLRTQNETAKFIAERLNKNKYSTKQEIDFRDKSEYEKMTDEELEEALNEHNTKNQRGETEEIAGGEA